MHSVWFARHGNRQDFVDPHWLESADQFYDPPLSQDGILQAQHLGQYLKEKGISHIFSSPFRRTVETACSVAKILDLPVKIEAGLSEMLFLFWMPSFAQQFSLEELAREFPRIDLNYTSRVRPKYPEKSWKQLEQRSSRTVKALVAEFPETLLLVSHDATIESAIWNLSDQSSKVDASELCCLFKLVDERAKWKIEPHDYRPNPPAQLSYPLKLYIKKYLKRRIRSILKLKFP